ncbi:RICIN domain-containing protein [Actinoplanes sp. NPDC049599]|uniref:RICIN domain-containing protein n=1 Tax=Actinoplanes sp. NPDC049599 TaxID=3363903 RepID=UPI0037AAB220
MRRKTLGLSAALMLGILVPGTPASAADGYRQIINRTGVCLEVDRARGGNGADVTVDWCSYAGMNQYWVLEPVGEGYYQIRVQHSGKCLDVRAGRFDDGTQIQEWTCAGVNNQHWKLVDARNGYYTIVARHSNKCLDKAGWNVVQWNCTGVHWQRWKLG